MVRVIFLFLTLSAHAREGYSSHFVSLSVSLSLFHCGEGANFRVETYISIYILGDDLSQCSTFWKIEAILEKNEWNFGRNCSDVCGYRPVIKRFST